MAGGASVGVGGITGGEVGCGVNVLVGVTGVLVAGMEVFVSVGAVVGTGDDVGRGVLFETGTVAVDDGLGVGLKYGIGVGGKRGT